MNQNTSRSRLVVWLGVPLGMALGLAAPGVITIGVVAAALLVVQLLRIGRAL